MIFRVPSLLALTPERAGMVGQHVISLVELVYVHPLMLSASRIERVCKHYDYALLS
jgi:hypothetical protein